MINFTIANITPQHAEQTQIKVKQSKIPTQKIKPVQEKQIEILEIVDKKSEETPIKAKIIEYPIYKTQTKAKIIGHTTTGLTPDNKNPK